MSGDSLKHPPIKNLFMPSYNDVFADGRSNSDRFLSRDDCKALTDRIFNLTRGGGNTMVNINTTWRGNLRWNRNEPTTGGDMQETSIYINRDIRGAIGTAITNAMDDASLRTCIARAEASTLIGSENPEQYPDAPPATHPHANPTLWFDTTYNLDAKQRGSALTTMIAPAEADQLLSAGYLETSGTGYAVVKSGGLFRYYPFTSAECSATVRNAGGTASGWAGVDFNDWNRIDVNALSQTAVDKCRRSSNPVAVEPGRYTAILEPQAVCDLFAPIIDQAMDRRMAEAGLGPFAAGLGNSKIGQKLLDERITVSADPMDPDAGFVPFDWAGEPYTPTNWFENGVLKALAYDRPYGLTMLNIDSALPSSRSFRISGGTATMDEMIATTKRGLVVTRFNSIGVIDLASMLLRGNTRDGLWLVENGKITKAVKNFRITESPLFIMNNIEQLGVPKRVYRPWAPTVVPSMKVLDFSFTGLMDAV